MIHAAGRVEQEADAQARMEEADIDIAEAASHLSPHAAPRPRSHPRAARHLCPCRGEASLTPSTWQLLSENMTREHARTS